MNNSTVLKTRQDAFVADMDSFERWNDKFSYIIELGESLCEMPEHMMVPANLLRGCISKTYFNVIKTDVGLRLFGWSNSPVMAGILQVVITIFDGLSVSADDDIYFHTQSGLIRHLTPQRAGALRQVISRIIATDDL